MNGLLCWWRQHFYRGHGAQRRKSLREGVPLDAVPTWYSNDELTAQFAHFFCGAFLLLAASLHVYWLWPMLAIIIVAILKEYIVDSWLPVADGGEGDSYLSSTLDWVMYAAGTVAGWAAWHWR